MITLENDVLVIRFPEVHADAVCRLDLQRTLRIPDDAKEYPLPAGLGRFPIQHLEDFGDRVPTKWSRRGGVVVPMRRAEALWINFNSLHGQEQYPFAFKIAAGKINAVTGNNWSNGLSKDQDYMVIPTQPWLDGFCVEKGVVRQFVAIPLGEGATVEEQMTGEAEHGGLQIIAYPMKASAWERILDQRRREKRAIRAREAFERLEKFRRMAEKSHRQEIERLSALEELIARAESTNDGFADEIWSEIERRFENPEELDIAFSRRDSGIRACAADLASDSLGFGAGGRMRQAIYEDPHGIEAWDLKNSSRCFVTLADAAIWYTLTGKAPPTKPIGTKEYEKAGIPWFDYYADGATELAGSPILQQVQSVLGFFGVNNGVSDATDTITPGKIIHFKNGVAGRPVDEGDPLRP